MTKLLSIVVASMFAFATTGALAQTTAPKASDKASEMKVDCKDVKNKDNVACKADAKAAASASKSEMKNETKTEKKASDKEEKKAN